MKSLNQLAKLFPTLEGLDVDWDVEVRDATTLKEKINYPFMSEGEKRAVDFVLWVFNPGVHRMDLFSSLRIWDSGHVDAFREWAKDPWFK